MIFLFCSNINGNVIHIKFTRLMPFLLCFYTKKGSFGDKNLNIYIYLWNTKILPFVRIFEESCGGSSTFVRWGWRVVALFHGVSDAPEVVGGFKLSSQPHFQTPVVSFSQRKWAGQFPVQLLVLSVVGAVVLVFGCGGRWALPNACLCQSGSHSLILIQFAAGQSLRIIF